MVYHNFIIDCYRKHSVALSELAASQAQHTSLKSLCSFSVVIRKRHMIFAFLDVVDSTPNEFLILVILQNTASLLSLHRFLSLAIADSEISMYDVYSLSVSEVLYTKAQ